MLGTRIFKHSSDTDRGGDARKAARTRSAAAAPSWSDVARAAKHCVPHRESSSPSHHHRKKRRKHATYLCVCVCVDFAFFCAERLLLILMADQHDTITHTQLGARANILKHLTTIGNKNIYLILSISSGLNYVTISSSNRQLKICLSIEMKIN